MPIGSDANNIEIKVVVDAAGAIKLLDQTGKEIGKLEQATKKADAGFSKFQASIVSLEAGLSLAGRAFNTLRSAGSAFFALMDRADQVEDLTNAFNSLHGGAAAASKELANLQKATAGTMSNMQLMAEANKAALVGLDDGSDRLQKLAEAAKVLGEAAGKSTGEAFDALVKAVGTGATRAAKELGVLIQAKKEDETQSQFMARAMAEIITKMRQVGDSAQTGASIAETIGVAWQNLGDTFATAASQSDVVKDALLGLKAVIDSIKPGAIVAVGDAVIGITTEIGKMAADVGTELGKGIGWLSGGAANKGVQQALGALKTAYENVSKGAKIAATGVKEHTKVTRENTSGASAAKKSADDLAKAYASLSQKIQEMTGAGGISELAQSMGDLLIKSKAEGASADQTAAALQAMADAALKSGVSIEDVNAALQDGQKVLQDHQRAVEEDAAAMQRLAEDGAGGLVDALSEIGSQFGINFSSSLQDSLTQGLTSLFPETMAFLGGPTGGLISGIGGTIINSIGLDKIFSSVKNLFGGHDPQQEFRDSVDEWFKKAFDGKRIKLIINGEMQELEGLDFSKYTGGLDGLSPEAASAFLGIGEGLQSLFGEAFEGFDGQLASVLAASVGNLNNLQMLFEQIGLSAEQAGQAVEDAFLNGDLSAGQFLQSSAAINDLYTQGIPGAIGATDQAIRNFAEGALTSGRIAKDALGDMAAELLEKNPAATLEDLRKELIAAGVSAEDTNKIMASFGKNGIDNLEELMNISTEQTAQIVDDLEKQGFAFEKPIEKADELIKKLEELEGKHITTYVDIVETTIHREEEQKMAKGGILYAALGRIVNSPTMVRPNVMAGEAGAEAVLPLRRGPGGILGVVAYPRSGGAPGGGGGERQSGANWGEWAKEFERGSVASEMIRLIEASADYATILNSLRAGTLDEAEAAKMLSKMRKDALGLLRQQEKLESKLAYAMEHRGKVSAKALEKLIEKLDGVRAKIDAIGGGEAGKTPEETAQNKIDAILEQFRAGKLTIEEAQAQIGAAEAGGGMGLPGLGDITGAMDALAGAKGGAAIEALRNLIIESKEAGYGLGELQDYLEGKGFDLSKLFTKFAAEGLNTMDEVLRASDADMIDYLASIKAAAPGMTPLIDALAEMAETVGGDDDDEGGGKKGKGGKKARNLRARMRKLRKEMEAIKDRKINLEIHTVVTGKGAALIDRITPGIGK